MREMENKISAYLKEYYKLDRNTSYEVKEVDPQMLLIPERLDLAAKLSYIQSKVEKKNEVLAVKLYDAHIAAFQDGIIIESGNEKKAGMEKYHKSLEHLIQDFIEERFDKERYWIPVDKRGVLLDGAHRVACAIYFKKPIKIIQFHEINGYDYDFYYFKKRALELEYLAYMANIFFEYKEISSPIFLSKHIKSDSKILYDGVCKEKGKKIKVGYKSNSINEKRKKELRNCLQIDRMEEKQEISVSFFEKCYIKIIRFIRNKYTRGIRYIKKQLRMPV